MTSDPTDLERQGWQALSTTPSIATEFYERVLDREPVFVLPGGMVLHGREQILESMSGVPWSWFRLEEMRELAPTDTTRLVVYLARARRGDDGEDEYRANITSMYVRREEGWRLVFHQQTPALLP